MTKPPTPKKTNTHGGYRWSLPPDQKRTRRNYRFPPDVIEILNKQDNETEFIIRLIRENDPKAHAIVKWEDVNFIIKWTIENAKHLSIDDTYLVEKETDKCLLDFKKGKQS